MTSGRIHKLVDANHFVFKKSNLKALRRNIPLCGPKHGKVKYLDFTSVKECYPQKPKVTVTVTKVSRSKPLNNLEDVYDPNCSMKATVQSVGSRKRIFDDVNDCNVNDEKKAKTVVATFRPPFFEKDECSLGSRQSGKDGYGGKPKVTTNVAPQNVNAKMTFYDNKDTPVDSTAGENHKARRIEPKELGMSKSYLDKRLTSKVKYWDPKEVDAQKWIEAATNVSSKEEAKREKIKEAMSIFDEVYEYLSTVNRLKPQIEKIVPWRVNEEVAKIVKRKLKWMVPEKIIGHVFGVQVGDKFRFRSQLQMVGLHCQPQFGIDYINFEGKNLAISIVDSHRYLNESKDRDRLIYCGHGGQRVMGGKQQIGDQKLDGGNLALKNSKIEKKPVRVIRKVKEGGKNYFLYDGLYMVSDCVRKRSEEGKLVFNFELIRIPGQPISLPNAPC